MATMIFLLLERTQATMGNARLAYQLLFYGINSLLLCGIFPEGNQTANPGKIVGGIVNLGLPQDFQKFDIKDPQTGEFSIFPFVEVEGSVELPGRTLSAGSSGGGDATIGSRFKVIGSPALWMKSL